jgi:hypothetical protein
MTLAPELESKLTRRATLNGVEYGYTTDEEAARLFQQRGFRTASYVRDSVTNLREWEIQLGNRQEPESVMAGPDDPQPEPSPADGYGEPPE